MRDAFNQAVDNAPCVLFIDEIESIGQHRRPRYGEGPNPQFLALTEELLVQLDGFDTDREAPVVVFGSTNQMDRLDPALLRSD